MRAEDRVYTPDSFPRPARGGQMLAVLGCPVAHSLSPVMQRAAFDELAERKPGFGLWDYVRIEVEPEGLGALLGRLVEAGYRGVNLTVPHKEVVLPLLQARDRIVERVGAANTLSFVGGEVLGSNTDGYGLLTGLEEDLGFVPEGKTVLILGAGGAARSAADAMAGGKAARIVIANRTPQRAEQLTAAMARVHPGVDRFGFCGLEQAANLLEGVDLVVNASAAGLKDNGHPPIALAKLERQTLVYDMVYSPPRTALLLKAASRGNPVANGLSMLLHQGYRSIEIWTGETPSAAAMRRAIEAVVDVA
ncbi:MAG: shikimate dehydrogenase [Puniceicoccaceae bacterium]